MKRTAWSLIAGGLAVLPAGAMAIGALFVPAVEIDPPAGPLGRALAADTWDQIRIEQHLIIRIMPGDPGMPRDVPPPVVSPPERLRQRRIAPCLPVSAIAGSRPLANNRLLLFMRDHRMVGADLSRNCTARDFYLGFYITPTADGLLCAGRDTIHSRAGTTCAIRQLHELVPAN